MEGVYILIAIAIFLAQLQNGFFTALLTAIFWPVWLAGVALFAFIAAFGSVIESWRK
jgi:hypothetical protein